VSRAGKYEDGPQHCIDAVTREACKQDFLGQVVAIQLRQEMSETRAHLIVAIGQQNEEGMSRTAPRQVVEEFQAGIIAPMNIFNDERHWPSAGLIHEELGQRRKEAAFLLFRIK
jgi:hypothetical protein